MHLERFDPAGDPGRVRACHAMYLDGAPVDNPAEPRMPERAFAGLLAHGWTEDRPQCWLATEDAGEPAGWYMIILPQRENTHLAAVTLLVAPARRRAGLGTVLVRHAAARAAAAGRQVLASDAREDSAAGAFWRALGGGPGIAEILRVLRLASVDAGRLAGLRAQAERAARGYPLLSWEGPVPQQHLAGYAALAEALNDAPRDAGHEGQHWDAARVRLSERRVAAQGLRYYTVAAADERGELAAGSQLGVDPLQPDWGYQELTAVAGRHRGHRLGLLVKLAMLDLLAAREPQLAAIITGNADGNKHMIAINEQLGFTELDRWRSWELSVDRALAMPARR